MLSNSVQPPTVEHVYAQWQERKESSSAATRGPLQEKDGHSRDVKEEDSVSLTCGDPMSQNHFRSSRAVRLKGSVARTEKLVSRWCAVRLLTLGSRVSCAGNRGRPSKTDVDTGWSKDDERQCSLCQKYGDRKPNVSHGFNSAFC